MRALMEPTAVVAELFDHLAARRWRAAASLFTAEFLEWFRSDFSGHLMPGTLQTVEDYLERDPRMPRAVAEYYVEQANRYPAPRLADVFAGIETEEDLERLDATERYARYLEARDPSTQIARHVRLLQQRHPEHADRLAKAVEQSDNWWNLEVLGAVVDDREAHVLVSRTPRSAMDPSPVAVRPAVLTLRLTDDGWRLGHQLELNHHIALGPIQVHGDDGDWISLSV